MNKTNIEWTDFTWNPITGCTPISDGCKNCYAKAVHERFNDTPFSKIEFHKDRLDAPFQRKKPAKIFIGSMTDIFHKDVDELWLDLILQTIMANPQHTFQILTKRPQRMKEYFTSFYDSIKDKGDKWLIESNIIDGTIQNLWLGVTVTDQKEADKNIPLLCHNIAKKHFLSIEPLVGEINLKSYYFKSKNGSYPFPYLSDNARTKQIDMIDWIIVGGETGAKSKTREIDPTWVRQIYNDCIDNDTAFFFKQWGSHKPNYKCEFENVKEFPI